MANNFLILGIVIIVCNIGLMFINEPQPLERTESQRQTDKMIENKIGYSNIWTKSVAWLTGTIIGPVISFFKKTVLI